MPAKHAESSATHGKGACRVQRCQQGKSAKPSPTQHCHASRSAVLGLGFGRQRSLKSGIRSKPAGGWGVEPLLKATTRPKKGRKRSNLSPGPPKLRTFHQGRPRATELVEEQEVGGRQPRRAELQPATLFHHAR